ncbi:hypothetical protein D9M72_399970 [compost metagenome]
MVLIRSHLELQQAGKQVFLGVRHRYAVAVVVVAGISLADAAEHREDVVETIGTDQRFRPAGLVAAVGGRSDAAVVLAVLDQVFDVVGLEVDRTGQSTAADTGDGTAGDVDLGKECRIEIGKALGFMAGEAEVLAHTVDHHVDAAGTLEATDVDGDARVLRVVGG